MLKLNYYFLLKTTDAKNNVVYLQHLVSNSRGSDGISKTYHPDYAWRTRNLMELAKKEIEVNNHPFFKDSYWEIKVFEMSPDIRSFANIPDKPSVYEDKFDKSVYMEYRKFKEDNAEELTRYESEMKEKYGDK